MKLSYTILLILMSTLIHAQSEIKIEEELVNFKIGFKNSITATIPYTKKESLEKFIRKELKEWNGKFNFKDGEFYTLQATTKFMGAKPFDTYVKIISSTNESIKIAFTTDLGGAFLSSKEHRDQFNAMSEKVKEFAKESTITSIEEDLEKNQDILSDQFKVQRSLEKEKKNLEEDIENYKLKIIDAEKKLKINAEDQENQKKSLKIQEEKVSDILKKLKYFK